ncbi:hypothetical protein APA_2847 [Pseudanabaena sp. lw0831]|nr:hypothetical protein APA_2847 [Pseudanabaena sp. lw0831]
MKGTFGGISGKNAKSHQFPIKRTTINFLKLLLSNTFKKFIGSELSAKRCNR